MRLSEEAVFSITQQLNEVDWITPMTRIWVRVDGSEARVSRDEPTADECNEWVCGGQLGVILRRGIEWED